MYLLYFYGLLIKIRGTIMLNYTQPGILARIFKRPFTNQLSTGINQCVKAFSYNYEGEQSTVLEKLASIPTGDNNTSFTQGETQKEIKLRNNSDVTIKPLDENNIRDLLALQQAVSNKLKEEGNEGFKYQKMLMSLKNY